VPRTFDELHHQDTQALSNGAKSGSERAGRFAFAGAGINDQESFTFWHVGAYPGGQCCRSIR
jgi:hypothetical protein